MCENIFCLRLTSKFSKRDSLLSISLLSLACRMVGISSITFAVKTFTAETQTRLTFASMLNSTRHVIHARPCVYREIHRSCWNKIGPGGMLCYKFGSCSLR